MPWGTVCTQEIKYRTPRNEKNADTVNCTMLYPDDATKRELALIVASTLVAKTHVGIKEILRKDAPKFSVFLFTSDYL